LEIKHLNDQEFIQKLVEAGYSEKVALKIEQWYNSQ
jgi:hypothetical protein